MSRDFDLVLAQLVSNLQQMQQHLKDGTFGGPLMVQNELQDAHNKINDMLLEVDRLLDPHHGEPDYEDEGWESGI